MHTISVTEMMIIRVSCSMHCGWTIAHPYIGHSGYTPPAASSNYPSQEKIRLNEKVAGFSFHHAPCRHAKVAAMVVLSGANHGQLDLPLPNSNNASDKKARIEYLWQELFSDPSQWWDNRTTKKTFRHPDFKHKTTREGLWVHSVLNPPWVKEKFTTMAFDRIISNARSTPGAIASFGNYFKVQKLTHKGRLKEALNVLELMAQQSWKAPDGAFVCLLRGCTKRKALAEGKQVHALIVKTKCDTNIFLSNLLIGMYGDCGSVAEALEVFEAMRHRNVFSWTAMISAYSKSRLYKEAVILFQQMCQAGIEPDEVACVVTLKACTNIAALEQGQQLHSVISKKGFDSNLVIQTALVEMYAKCGCLKDARELFDNMAKRDVISWNTMITCYAQRGLGKEALVLYEQMKHEGMEPDNVTLLLLLKACASISALQQGKQLHSIILKKGLESEITIQNMLVDMYAKCGCLMDARELFDSMAERDVISWNAMITGYAQKGFGKEALDLYEQMKHEGTEPDNVTLVLLLKACASISSLQLGKQLHSLILKKGLESEKTIQTTLVDMYSKCGCLEDARELFNKMPQRDVVSCSTMIAGYAQKGFGKEALDLFEQMKHEGLEPDNITLVLLLKACASSSALQEGKQLHSLILEKGLESDIAVQNTLIDMYAKCGCLKDAREVFDNMVKRDVICWNVMIASYAQEGLGQEALDLFFQMKDEGLQASDVTYTCVLSACSHSGLVDEGRKVYENMCKDHGVTPTLKHYGCMVDLLGRAGCLSDAEDLILKMPIQPDKTVWMSLLGASRKYANVEIGRHAFEHIVELDPENSAAYVLLTDMYSAAGRMDEVAQVRKEMIDKGLDLGCNWIEVDNQVQAF